MMRAEEKIIKVSPFFLQQLLQVPVTFFDEFLTEFTPGNSGLIGDQDNRNLPLVELGDGRTRPGQQPDILEPAQVVNLMDYRAVPVEEYGALLS
jgi:hypothetical protein